MQCIPGGFDEGRDIPGGSGVKGLDVAMLSSHPIVLGGRHIAQRSSLHSIYSFRGCTHLHCMGCVWCTQHPDQGTDMKHQPA